MRRSYRPRNNQTLHNQAREWFKNEIAPGLDPRDEDAVCKSFEQFVREYRRRVRGEVIEECATACESAAYGDPCSSSIGAVAADVIRALKASKR